VKVYIRFTGAIADASKIESDNVVYNHDMPKSYGTEMAE